MRSPTFNAALSPTRVSHFRLTAFGAHDPTLPALTFSAGPNYPRTDFYKALLESNAAEHGGRMTAMPKATDNADSLLKRQKLSYNNERQASITSEILEIAGGAEALKG